MRKKYSPTCNLIMTYFRLRTLLLPSHNSSPKRSSADDSHGAGTRGAGTTRQARAWKGGVYRTLNCSISGTKSWLRYLTHDENVAGSVGSDRLIISASCCAQSWPFSSFHGSKIAPSAFEIPMALRAWCMLDRCDDVTTLSFCITHDGLLRSPRPQSLRQKKCTVLRN